MISDGAKRHLESNFDNCEDIDFNSRFKYVSDKMLKEAIKLTPCRNIFNLIDKLFYMESDKDKRAILLGYKNHDHMKRRHEEIKEKIKSLCQK